MTDPAPELELRRSRDVGELLRDAGRVYFRTLPRLLALAAAIVIPVELIVSGLGLEQLTSGHQEDPKLAETLIPTLTAFLITAPLITAMCIHLLEEVSAGKRPPLGEIVTRGLEAFRPLFPAVLIAAAGIALGLALFVLPGIYVAIRWFFVPQAVVLDRATGVDPLRRSSAVVAGFWWRTFGIVVLANVIAFIPQAVIVPLTEALSESADRELISLAGRALSEILTTPFVALVATLLWFDLQARRG